ncbi:MAG: hypothetical protein ACQGVC_03435 [Myxococcota bacterium]
MRTEEGKAISVAWVFPPAKTGWMGLRGIAIGCDRSLLTEGPHPAAFQEYFDTVSRLRGAKQQETSYVAAVELPPEELEPQISLLLQSFGELRRRIAGQEKPSRT